MKNCLRKFLCSLISLATIVSGTAALAADNMEVEWYGDYSDSNKPKLVVVVDTPAKYQQQITTAIYPASVTTPAFEDYLRISEVTVDGGGKKEVVFNITNEFNATDYAYGLKLQGNGYMSDTSGVTETVYVIAPSRIPSLLSAINGATSATFATAFAEVMPALQLADEADPATKTKKINLMIGMKSADYSGAFATLEDVRDAWKKTDVLAYISDSSATAETLKGKIIENSELLGVDTEDADFIANADELSSDILLYASEYNNSNGILSCTDFSKAVNQYLGIIVINASSEDEVDDSFAKYKDFMGISADTMSKYNSLNNAQKGKALRAIYNKNFERASELVTAFKGTVDKLYAGGDTSDTPIVIVPGGNSTGNGSGSSVTGGGAAAPTTPTQTPVKGFTDVASTHWASKYIEDLASKNIINGYDDNTFKPSKNVTREEFVKMIIGATGMLFDGASCEFSDVPSDAWYYEYIAAAYEKGIVSGTDEGSFGVGTNITRQDVAVIAARIYTRLMGTTPTTGESTLTDFDTISDYAQESVKLLNGMGIINGFDDGSFMPHNALTRAEAATIIWKLMEKM